MLAQQQTLTQLMELLQHAKLSLVEAVQLRGSSGAVCDMHSDEDARRRVLAEDRWGPKDCLNADRSFIWILLNPPCLAPCLYLSDGCHVNMPSPLRPSEIRSFSS